MVIQGLEEAINKVKANRIINKTQIRSQTKNIIILLIKKTTTKIKTTMIVSKKDIKEITKTQIFQKK